MTDVPSFKPNPKPGRFEDPTPVTLTVRTTNGALAALLDHPALMCEPEEGMYFVKAVHRGVADLRAARAGVEASAVARRTRLDRWLVQNMPLYWWLSSCWFWPGASASTSTRRDQA